MQKNVNSLVKQLDEAQNNANPGADPDRGERGSSHGQIFSTLKYSGLTFFQS